MGPGTTLSIESYGTPKTEENPPSVTTVYPSSGILASLSGTRAPFHSGDGPTLGGGVWLLGRCGNWVSRVCVTCPRPQGTESTSWIWHVGLNCQRDPVLQPPGSSEILCPCAHLSLSLFFFLIVVGSFCCDSAVANLTRIHEDAGSIPGLSIPGGLRIQHFRELWCRLQTRLGSVLLWRRLAGVALIQPLAWGPPYAMGVALKKKGTVVPVSFSHIIFHHGLSQETGCSSLCCTVGSHCFFHSRCNSLHLCFFWGKFWLKN